MTKKEEFRDAIAKIIFEYHDKHSLRFDDQVNILRDILKTVDQSKPAVEDSHSDWFKEWRKEYGL